MNKMLSLEHSLDSAAVIVAFLALLGVLQTFIVGQHFVIPTLILILAVIFANLAAFGLRGERWAKHILFWIFSVAACHAFFALFWAKTPREMLGDAFLYVYGAAFVILALLSWQYAKKNKLFQWAQG
jgi:hypothetical protein